jgi:hypothetical protein
MMEQIIKPLDKKILKQELQKIQFIRPTVRGSNEIYAFSYKESPALMDEVGRLRELSYRGGGGGTGKAKDIDNYDTAEIPFRQLIVYDPDNESIVGGYRFLMGSDIKSDENGIPLSPTSKLFSFSKHFLEKYWNNTMELGRAFVQPDYQPNVNRQKGLYALDNLWDGLGSLVVDFPEMKYFFGKNTMYPDFNKVARDLILYFLQKHFPDHENMITPNYPVNIETDQQILSGLLTEKDFKEDYKILNREVRARNEFIPPLFTAYMNLSQTMKSFGTSVNHSFGNVEETGIMITIADIYTDKVERYTKTYHPVKRD